MRSNMQQQPNANYRAEKTNRQPSHIEFQQVQPQLKAQQQLAQQQLSSVRTQRLTKQTHNWASTRVLLPLESDVVGADEIPMSSSNQNLKKAFQEANMLLREDRPEDFTTTLKKSANSSNDVGNKQQLSYLQSGRLKHLQNLPHSYITSNEQLVENGSDQSESSIIGSKPSPRVIQRFKNFPSRHRTGGDSNGQQISSARNITPRDLKDSITPALLSGSHLAASQRLLHDIHSTESGNPIPQNQRHRSEQISKVRQRPSANDIFGTSASSVEEETNPNFMTKHTTSGLGRLLFKRQEKNAGKPSQGLHQRQQKRQIIYHPAPEKAYSNISGNTRNFVESSLKQPKLYTSGDQTTLISIQKPGNMLKIQIGDKKRQTTLKQGFMASPRSDEPQLNNMGPSGSISQASFDRDRHHVNYQSFEELKKGNSVNQGQRLMRQIAEEPVEAEKVISQSKKPTKTKHQRFSNKLMDRINSQQVLTHEIIMDIREEFSDQKHPENLIDKLQPTRSSIPVLSTKHFLETESIEKTKESNEDQEYGPDQNRRYDKSLAFEARDKQKKHTRNQEQGSGALHQHSSSVLPSHRHRHLLSSINAGQLVSNEQPSQLQRYSVDPAENEQLNIYHSVVDFSGPHSGSNSILKPISQQPSRYAAAGGNFRYKKNQNQQNQLSTTSQTQIQVSTNSGPTQNGNSYIGGNLLVNKVQQKNQQFKFQFSRKSQQSNSFKLMNAQRAIQQPAPVSSSNGQPIQAAPRKFDTTKKTRFNSNRTSHVTNVQTENYTERNNYEHVDDNGEGSGSKAIPMVDSRGKKFRNKKVLASESPTQNRFTNGQKFRVNKPAKVAASNDASDVSDFTQMINQSQNNSRGRLQSLSMKPKSFTKRLTDIDKVITSSQNSGGNISGLTVMNPQRHANSPLKQPMPTMNQSSSPKIGENNTTQKHQRLNTVYDNLNAQKQKQKPLSSERYPGNEHLSAARTQKRGGYVFKGSSVNTASQNGSINELVAVQSSLPLIQLQSKDIKSREISPIIQSSSSHREKGSQVGNFQNYAPNQKSELKANAYITRKSVQGRVQQMSTQDLKNGVYDDLVKIETFDTKKQKTNGEDSPSPPGSSMGFADNQFNGQKSLNSAQNILTKRQHEGQLNLVEKVIGLSKTSSTSKFQIKVISNTETASEIVRLQNQIKQREIAYSSLKNQFERLRKRVADKLSPSESIDILEAEHNNFKKSGQAAFSGGRDLNEQHQVNLKLMESMNQELNFDSFRNSLNDLDIQKQRSSSAAAVHFQLSIHPPISSEIEIIEEVLPRDILYRTPGRSKLKQPTKFDVNRAVTTRRSSDAHGQASINQEKLIAELKKKTSKFQQIESSLTPQKSNLSKKRGSLPGHLDGRSSRQAISNDSKKLQKHGIFNQSQVQVSLVSGRQKALPLKQKNKGVTQQVYQSASHASLKNFIQNPPQGVAKQQIINNQPKSTKKSKGQKSKTTTAKITSNGIGEPTLAAVTQTNKLAIQNLRQVIKSATKKFCGGIKKQRNIPVQQSQLGIMIEMGKQLIEKGKYEELDTVVEKRGEHAEEMSTFDLLHQTSFGKKHQSTENPPNSSICPNKFTCAGMHQIRLETEPMQEDPIKNQENSLKEETPSNEQSQNSPHPQPAHQTEESKEFKTTGTAFGTTVQPQLKLARQAQNYNALARQAAIKVNSFGLFPHEELEKSVNLRVIAIEESQQSAAFPIRNSNLSQPQISEQSAVFGQKSLEKQSSLIQISQPSPTLQSRCETPIHPNQVLDGIKFMEVQDPTYKMSDVFNHCQDMDDESAEQFFNQENHRASTPIMPMNSTGKEFFAKKKQNDQQAQAAAAAQIQKSTIQILKQLQKKKQGMAANTQRKQVQHPKVVINQNNPFFIPKQSKAKHLHASEQHPSVNNNSSASFLNNHSGAVPYQTAEYKIEQNGNLRIPNTNQYSNIKKVENLPSISKTHNTSMVSQDMFYSPVMNQRDNSSEGSEEGENRVRDQAIEIFPQYSNRSKAQLFKRKSDAMAPPTYEAVIDDTYYEGSFPAASFNHVQHKYDRERDDILDDSLLFAIQDERPQYVEHLEDEYVDVETTDIQFFAKQISFQPDIIRTPRSESQLEDLSNMKDLIPTTSHQVSIGEGLLITAFDIDGNVTPGLTQQKLEKPFKSVANSDAHTTDKKGQAFKVYGVQSGKVSAQGVKSNSGVGTKGGKLTLTEAIQQSGINLTYSEDTSALKSVIPTVSDWIAPDCQK